MDLFTFFRTDVPGSAASIAAGVSWLGNVEPKDSPGVLFVRTLEGLRQPTHLHEMIGSSVVGKLLKERRADVGGRPLSVVTARELKQK